MKTPINSRKSLFCSKRKGHSLAAYAVLAAALPAYQLANAATVTWDGGAGAAGTTWGEPLNWAGNVSPLTTDSVSFNLTTTKTISLGAPQTVNTLIFNGASAAFTIGDSTDTSSGNALTLTNVTRSATTTVAQTIAANVELAGNSIWNIGTGSGVFSASGIISESNLGTSLTKTGVGALTLNGASANTYTGSTVVNQGTLILDFANMATPTNLVSASSTLTLGGGTLQVKQKTGAATSQTFASTVVNAGASAISGASVDATGLTIALGAITRTSTSGTIGLGGGGGTLNFTLPTDGSITTTTGNTASGILGTWATVGSGANFAYATVTGDTIGAYTGATAATAADLSNVTSATTNYSFGAAATLGKAITANTLQYTGGAATLANGGFTTTLNGLMNAGTGTLTINGSGKVTIGASRELVIQSSGQNIVIASVIANNAAGKSGLTFSGPGVLNLTGVNTFTGDTTVLSGTLTFANATPTLGNIVVGSVGGGPAAQFGSSSYVGTKLGGANTNVTVYSNGKFYAYDGSTTGTGIKNFTINGGYALVYNTYVSGAITMTGGTLTTMSNGFYGLEGGSVINTNACDTTAMLLANLSSYYGGYTFTVADGAAAVDLTVSGTINNVASAINGGMTKAGSGVMQIGGANTGSNKPFTGNTFAGATTVNDGTLLLSNSFALQNSPLTNGGKGIVFDSSVASRAFQIGGLNGSGDLALQNNAATPLSVALTVNNNTTTPTSYSGILSGAGNITKIGTGNQIFTGANTYTGATIINSGTLQIGNGGTTGSIDSTSGVSGSSGAYLAFNRSNALTFDRAISGGLGVNQVGAGTTTLTAANTYTGATTISNGKLALQGAGSIDNSTIIDVKAGAGLDVSALSAFTIGASQTLQGEGTVTGPAAGALLVNGTLSPAASAIGTLNVINSLTLAGTTVVDLDKTGGVLTNDLVTGAITLTLGGTLSIHLTGDALIAGDAFTLFGGTSIGGSFSTYNLPVLDTGLAWDTSHLVGDGELLVVAVPEPATWAFMVGGLGLLAFMKRARRNLA